MQALLTNVAIVFLLVVAIRFAFMIYCGAGLLHAGWESAGWLTLAMIASIVYTATGTETAVGTFVEAAQPRVTAATNRLVTTLVGETDSPQQFVTTEKTRKNARPASPSGN